MTSAISSNPRVFVCGVGALGSNAVVAMRNLAASLVLVDGDRVESKNLLAQAYVKSSVGKLKADALKMQLANFYGLRVETHAVRVVPTNIQTVLAGASLLVDAFDNASSRRLLSAYASEHAVPLLHAGISADGTFGLVRWDSRFVPDEESTEGEATCEGGAHLPMISAIGAQLALVVQDFLSDGVQRDVMVSRDAVIKTH